jgi:pimeloyl-[acyl-carrier protein] methyl ester esterase
VNYPSGRQHELFYRNHGARQTAGIAPWLGHEQCGMGARDQAPVRQFPSISGGFARHGPEPSGLSILGWSLGGLVAQQIALNQPDRVEKLILVGTNPCFVSKPDWPHGIAARHFEQFNERFAQDFNATLLNFLTLQCMHAKDARSTVRQLRIAFAAKPTPTQDSLNQALDILLQTDLREEVGRLFQPALIIHGDRDTLAPVSAAHWLAMHLQRAHLRVIAGAAHAPFLSHAEAFCEAVEAFMADEPAARGGEYS